MPAVRKRIAAFDPFGTVRRAPHEVAGFAQRVFPVVNVLGFTTLLFAGSMLVPLAFAHLEGDAAVDAFDRAVLITLAAGVAMWLATMRYKRELQPRDGFLLVGLAWLGLPAFASLPLILWSAATPAPLSFGDAYFEAVSGLTTTGSTIITGLDALPRSINLWRHLLHWLGGLGILVLMVAILPLLGVGGSQVYKAETPGPMKNNKLTPRITETAKGLYRVYVAITVACTVGFLLAGMDWFDAVCHAFTTVSLGGFSTHDASFAAFADRPWTEVVCVFFMCLCSVSFSIHFLALRARSIRPYYQCPEARWVLLALIGGGLLVSAFLWLHQVYDDPLTALRHGMFNTVSLASTTGLVSVDYALWPSFAPVLMLFLSCFATSSGSTGGGIKMIRAVVLFKQTRRELSRSLHPRMVNPVHLGRSQVDSSTLYAILAFMLLYGVTVIVGTFVLLFSGLDPTTAFTAVVGSINNAGPGLGAVGPSTNFSVLDPFQTWVCSALMLLGRLEMVSLLVLFTPTFWRK